ncbi:MAG: hypothetical protein N2053_12810, partial [Chitinispirillaceae bacterium]|nr:hypothetical protein [Chitinispirillaceae bacterium]
VLYQGKNRQIRRLFEAINVNISRLKRVQFAHLKLGELKAGEIRPLTKREIEAMKNIGYKG